MIKCGRPNCENPDACIYPNCNIEEGQFKIWKGKKYPVNTIEEEHEFVNMRAKSILFSIRKKRFTEVSMWDVMLFRQHIMPYVQAGGEYEDVYDEVVELIDRAKESL